MKKNFILLLCLIISNIAYSQVGINTESPKAMLDVVSTGDLQYLPLRISPISSNLTNTQDSIDYTKASQLYIDDNGYLFSAFSPAQLQGVAMSLDVNGLSISSSWTDIAVLTFRGAIAEFTFFTNQSFGSAQTSLISGKVLAGYGSFINIYAYNTTVEQGTVTGNISTSTSITYSSGATNLEFQLTSDNRLQVRTSATVTNGATITIYNSVITRLS